MEEPGPREWLRKVQAPALIEAAVAAALKERPSSLISFFANHFTELLANAEGSGPLPPSVVGENGPTISKQVSCVGYDGPHRTPRASETLLDPGIGSNIPNPSSPGLMIPRAASDVSPVRVVSDMGSPPAIQDQLRKAQQEVARLEALLNSSSKLPLPLPSVGNSEEARVLTPGGARHQMQVTVPGHTGSSRWRMGDDGVSPRSESASVVGLDRFEMRKRQSGGGKVVKQPSGVMLGRSDTMLKANEKLLNARACVVCGRDDNPGEERKSGFKCFGCVGLPSNPRYVKQLEEGLICKGRTDEGDFVVNDYTVVRPLGAGAYGKVRLVMHNKSSQPYAVKVLPKSTLKKRWVPSRDGQSHADPVQRAKEEVLLMAKLKHPNVVQIYGTMEDTHELMIIMEFLEHGPCYPSEYPAEPLPVPKLQRYWLGIAKGLQYLHDNKVIHRDIKPDNILLDMRDNIKLADFGVSSQMSKDGAEEAHTVTGFIGTPHFMPPEAFDSSSREGEPTDVWAFGVTAYAMAFGKLPPWGNVKKLQDLATTISDVAIPFGHSCQLVDSLLRKMLRKAPAKRINVDGIIQHPLFATIRLVKGQPVENKEVKLDWDKEARTLVLSGCSDPDPATGELLEETAGLDVFTEFFEESQNKFQVLQSSDFSITLYDVSRDPRRSRLRELLISMEETKKVKKGRQEKLALEREKTDLSAGRRPTGEADEEESTNLDKPPDVPKTWEEHGVKECEWDDSDLEDGLQS